MQPRSVYLISFFLFLSLSIFLFSVSSILQPRSVFILSLFFLFLSLSIVLFSVSSILQPRSVSILSLFFCFSLFLYFISRSLVFCSRAVSLSYLSFFVSLSFSSSLSWSLFYSVYSWSNMEISSVIIKSMIIEMVGIFHNNVSCLSIN